MTFQDDLKKMSPDTLDLVHQRLQLIGVVLGQIALLEVVADPYSSANSKVQAAKVLTNTGVDPQILAERLKSSVLANKSPAELRELVKTLRSVETLEAITENSETLSDSPEQLAKSEPKGSIHARVYRAETDEWEDLGLVSGPDSTQVTER